MSKIKWLVAVLILLASPLAAQTPQQTFVFKPPVHGWATTIGLAVQTSDALVTAQFQNEPVGRTTILRATADVAPDYKSRLGSLVFTLAPELIFTSFHPRPDRVFFVNQSGVAVTAPDQIGAGAGICATSRWLAPQPNFHQGEICTGALWRLSNSLDGNPNAKLFPYPSAIYLKAGGTNDIGKWGNITAGWYGQYVPRYGWSKTPLGYWDDRGQLAHSGDATLSIFLPMWKVPVLGKIKALSYVTPKVDGGLAYFQQDHAGLVNPHYGVGVIVAKNSKFSVSASHEWNNRFFHGGQPLIYRANISRLTADGNWTGEDAHPGDWRFYATWNIGKCLGLCKNPVAQRTTPRAATPVAATASTQ